MTKPSTSMLEKGVGFWSEFRAFAVKGDVFDLAVAVLIGNAFGAIVNSLVTDLIMPLLGLLTASGSELKNLSLTLRASQPPLVLHYGLFLQAVLNFFIIALSIFLVFKLISGARKRLLRQRQEVV